VVTALRRLAQLSALLSVALAGCSPANSVPPRTSSPSAVATPSIIAASPSPGITASPSSRGTAPQLLVLGKTGTGGAGLWTLDVAGAWSAGVSDPDATALARDGQRLTIARQDGLEFRTVARPNDRGTSVAIGWGFESTGGAPAGLDTSDAGRAAVAIVDSEGIYFAMTDERGGQVGLTPLLPAPESPFGPSVAWLDADRLAVLDTDAMQVSRLAVVDTSKGTIALLPGLAGVRTFALSPDRRVLAAATEAGVYIAPVSDWLGGKTPAKALVPTESQVVWGLALNAAGTRLALLSGAEAADGSVTDIHDMIYEVRAGAWQRILDAPAPFDQPSCQVWLT